MELYLYCPYSLSCYGRYYLLTLLLFSFPSILPFPSPVFFLAKDLFNRLSDPSHFRTLQVNMCKRFYGDSWCCRMYVLLHVLLTVTDMCYCVCCWQLLTCVTACVADSYWHVLLTVTDMCYCVCCWHLLTCVTACVADSYWHVLLCVLLTATDICQTLRVSMHTHCQCNM